MKFQRMSRKSVLVCFALYCIVFLMVRLEMEGESTFRTQTRLELLMFVLPGAITALTARTKPLSVALSGALLASPFCLVVLFLQFKDDFTFLLQEFAFVTSAIFWCGSGAMLIMLGKLFLAQLHKRY
ncbi:MAG: Inner membrane protein YbjM [Candidatus Erwinia impunctatus]|nr:Inner membrane protein YbjM [Culicoides impunctatus]